MLITKQDLKIVSDNDEKRQALPKKYYKHRETRYKTPDEFPQWKEPEFDIQEFLGGIV